jgi:hypothetical protein
LDNVEQLEKDFKSKIINKTIIEALYKQITSFLDKEVENFHKNEKFIELCEAKGGKFEKISQMFKKIQKSVSVNDLTQFNNIGRTHSLFDFLNMKTPTSSEKNSVQKTVSAFEIIEAHKNTSFHELSLSEIPRNLSWKLLITETRRIDQPFKMEGILDNPSIIEQKLQKMKTFLANSKYIVLIHDDSKNYKTSEMFDNLKKTTFKDFYERKIKLSIKQKNDKITIQLNEINRLKNEHSLNENFQKPTNLKQFLIKRLVDRNIVKHVISCSTDGMLRKVGIPEDQLSEFYGNEFIEGTQTDSLTQ